jgi:hypothetical protein
MSLELLDFRTKITIETAAAMEAENLVTGKDKTEIARDVLAAWAMEKIHKARLLNDALKEQGLSGIDAACYGVRGKA